MKRKIALFLTLSLSIGGFAQTGLRINEIMISNIDGYVVDNDFPDSWVEIYNSSNKAVSLKDLSLENVTSDGTEKYTFPNGQHVPAHGFFVICCDKLAKTYHTNYKLEADGGTLTLRSKEGTVVDCVSYPEMIAPGVGYGRTAANTDVWQWEREATPMTANNGVFTDILLPNPVFSSKGHVMSEVEEVTISMPEGNYPEDTKIYVTFDGKEPTMESESAKEFHFTIDTSTVIRAKLMSGSALSNQSVAQSYIYHPRETSLPIVSITTDAAYLFDNKFGICSTDTVMWAKPNYLHDWRRPINIEYLGLKGDTALFNQLGETAISGGVSRRWSQKSLKVYANKRFGTKRFKGQLWEEKPNVTKHKSFILRNGGNTCNTSRINDASIQRLFGSHIKELDYQAYSPAIIYINGDYYGVCGLRERSNEDYVYGNYDGLEDIEVATAHSYYKLEEEAPSFQDFSEIYHRDDVTYAELEQLMDVDNFMKVFIAECFSVNEDYPHNNVSMWRPTVDGGKWRWILKDMDHTGYVNPHDYNMFKYMLGTSDPQDQEYANSTRSTTVKSRFLYEKMMSFPEFREKFLDTYSVYLGDFCKPSVSAAIVKDMRDAIVDEIMPTSKTHNMPNLKFFDKYVGNLYDFYNCRPRIVYGQMAQYFSLGSVVPMTLSTNGVEVQINEISLTEGDFDGCYFSERELRLNSGASNACWKMTTFTNGTVVEEKEFLQPEVSLWLKDYAACDSVAFEMVVSGKNGFEQKLETLGLSKSDCTDWSIASTITIDEPRYAYANITVDSLPTSKYDDRHAYIEFYDNNGNYMRKPILLNLQGSSEPKVNLSVQFTDSNWSDSDAPSLTFGNWVAQDEFHLKAFQNDGLRGTAEIAYKLYDEMIGVTEGARMTGDAFPMSLYINGIYYGMMSWQLKKHRKNMDLAKDNGAQVWLDGKLNDKQLFGGTVNWTKFEVRNPKDLYNMDGTDYDGDYPQEIIDASSAAYTGKNKMKRCAEAKEHILALSQYNNELLALEASGASDEEMKTAIGNRYDIENLVNYVVFSLVTNNYDGFSDNWQWYTRDGQHWAVAPYNCELTFGYNDDDVTSLWSAEKSSKKYDYHMDNALGNGPMVWIKKYFWSEVSARYAELRDSGVLSVENIVGLAAEWQNRIGEAEYETEFAKWSAVVNDDSERLTEWVTERLSLEDEYMGYNPLMTYELDMTGKIYSTICLPFSFVVPKDVALYRVDYYNYTTKEKKVTKIKTPEANKPYLVVCNKKLLLTISGVVETADPEDPDYLKLGCLTGVYSEMPLAANDIVMYKNKFIKLTKSTAKGRSLSPYSAYIKGSAQSPNAAPAAIEEATGIEELDQSEGMYDAEMIYDVNGTRMLGTRRGINILKLQNGTIRKIIY